MNTRIDTLIAGLEAADAPTQLLGQTIASLQQQGYFMLALEKQRRRQRVLPHFAGKPVTRIVLGHVLRHLLADQRDLTVETLAADFFSVADDEELERKAAFLAGAVVICDNNDAGFHADGYARLTERCGETIFVVWDQDNHHWLKNSTRLAAHCDVYSPAHNDNLYALSRINSSTLSPIACSVIQWSRRFLEDGVSTMLSQPRSDEPLGRHSMYGAFGYRNQVVATLNKSIPSVCFVNGRQFHTRTPEDRLVEWASHKAHWIVPTLNDIPQRLFDALATGGIPLVPASLRHFTPVSEIPREHIVFYDASDVVDPTRVVAEALRKFDSAGAGGIVARHRLGVEQHHGDQRLARILGHVTEIFQMAPARLARR